MLLSKLNMGIYDDLNQLNHPSPAPAHTQQGQEPIVKDTPQKRKSGLSDSPLFPAQPEPSLQKEAPATPKRKQVNKQTSTLVNMFTSKQVYINKYLSEKAYRTASWRVPQEIVDKFEEMYYLAKSKYRSDVKRYELIVAALALFLWDFETNGEESDLYKLLIEKEQEKK
jgi:hypothetical protein